MAVDYVCGGHGAYRNSHGPRFIIPRGITLYFYIAHGQPLPNSIGQQVDQFVNTGRTIAYVGHPLRAGEECYPYHLYNHRGGGYLNLKMTSKANPNYISHPGPGGRALEDILKMISLSCEDAHVHWSACRSIEDDSDPEDFPEDQPAYIDLSQVKTRDFGDISNQLNIALQRPPGTIGALSSDTTNLSPVNAKKHGKFCKMKKFFFGKK
ncbi:MAG: putative adhesin [Gammaproteobacteria bacterium]